VEDENPVEKVHEDVHERAERSKEPWVAWVALTTALLAAVAALASSLSSHHESEGILGQIRASDGWAYYQAKGIKQEILKTLRPDSSDIQRYAQEEAKIRDEAQREQDDSKSHMRLHKIYANAVMFSQIAIAVAAISVLTRRPPFWFVSLGFGLLGLWFLAYGLMR